MYNWIYYKNHSTKFPEKYELHTDNNDRLYAQFNRKKGLVQLQIHTQDGNRWESMISNGVIISEKDLKSNRSKDLDYQFSSFQEYLSTIPDTKILDILHQNYGVDKNFDHHIIHHTPFNVEFNELKNLKERILYSWLKIKQFVLRFRFLDILDIGFIALYCYGIYLINYNIFQAGLMAIIGSILVGYSDILIKKKEVSNLKVSIILFSGIYIAYLGLKYQ